MYKYETHLHTREASACASCKGEEYIDVYLRLGYKGIIVTDHFFNGNCAIDPKLSWEDRVELFCKGYENAKAEGDKRGLDVFFGWESNYDCDEYLIYGLDKKWLLKHPEMMGWTQREQLEHVRADGGLVVHAHPFRERNYIKEINLHNVHADALEVCNAGNSAPQNALAYAYCKKLKMPMTSGSDIHHSSGAAFGCFGMVFNEPLKDISDYVKQVKAGKGYKVIIPSEHRHSTEESRPSLPIFLYDYDGNKKQVIVDELL